MFQEPNYKENLSQILSKVLDEIGINERMVMSKRRVYMMIETMNTITQRSIDRKITRYCLGSQSEGTTTGGLKSDVDLLICKHDINVIQDLCEWEQGKLNLLMIQNENTTPGYCFLQLIRTDEPLPETVIPNDEYISDTSGRILLENKVHNVSSNTDAEQHGPSLASKGQEGFCDTDIVLAFPCKSWPQSASRWLERQDIRGWPTQEMRSYMAGTSCFIVPTGSKVSVHPNLEMRISTTLAERCLMFNLNITHIRCYVLMKIILKSFLNLKGEINISSFMCKTVLLKSIKSTEPFLWKEINLFTCLTYCLLELNSCVRNAHCPHFIISENNLMAGQFTTHAKYQLSKNICDFIQSDGQWLLRINIDDVGHRLQVKMSTEPQRTYMFASPLEIRENLSALDYINFAYNITEFHRILIEEINDMNIEAMRHFVARLMTYRKTGNRLEHVSCRFLTRPLFTTFGSALASSNIGRSNQVSHEALAWLSAGLTSDNSSGRLKLASVIYSTGDMEKTELLLTYIEKQYYSFPILPICTCFPNLPTSVSAEFKRVCYEQNENYIKSITTFCVTYLQKEINCVPRELQYEMFRSTQDDMRYRHPKIDFWMNMAVVDCLPYLYFLQYKTYSFQGKYQEQQQALSNLIRTTKTDQNLYHRETAFNILGQCMEQENSHQVALKCYLLSLKQRARNNAANFHICRLLSSVLALQIA